MIESPPGARMEVSDCAICRDIPDFAAARPREGERLPAAVEQLADAYPDAEDSGYGDTRHNYQIAKKCPRCGQLYTCGYHYEFSPGYVEEVFWIERRADEPGSQS
jgi:hypothetical protein